jgi:hypothetical protein
VLALFAVTKVTASVLQQIAANATRRPHCNGGAAAHHGAAALRLCISAESVPLSANFFISAESGTSLHKSTDFCRKVHTFLRFLQKFKIYSISAERCTPFCRNLRFLQKGAHLSAKICRNLRFLQKSAERCTPLCRNLRFLQKSKISSISAEICRKVHTFLQKEIYRFLSAEIYRFLQKGAHLSAISAEI